MRPCDPKRELGVEMKATKSGARANASPLCVAGSLEPARKEALAYADALTLSSFIAPSA
jgi:hypothetical protein